MNKEGLALLKEFEGVKLKAYIPVPGDVPTIGYGHTKGVKMGDEITKAKAESLLKEDIKIYEDAVTKACKVTPNENQLAACACLSFNIGIAGFLKSSVLKAHNRGDSQSAARAFGLWNKSGGVVYAGLTRRRSAEASLYLKPVPEEQTDHPMPQTIDEEKSLGKSPIGIMGGLTTATGVLGTVSSVGGQANDAAGVVGGVVGSIKTARSWASDAAAAIGLTPIEIFCVALVVIGGVVMVYRYLQRKNGWV